MPKSQNDLSTAVLRQIGVLGAEETAETADVLLIQGIYLGKHVEWTSRGYADWPNLGNPATAEIPDDRFQILTLLVSNEVLSAFGTPNPEEQRVSREQLLLVSLRRLVGGTAESTTALRTKKHLSTAVLRKLGVIDPLANPSSKDAQIVWSAYDDKLKELTAKGLVFWTNTNESTAEIPKEVFVILVALIANDLATWFGQEQSDADRVALEAQLLSELRQHVPGTEDPDTCGDMTKTQLSTAVLRRLKMIKANETPATKDAAYVWAAYDAIYARLTSRDMTYWSNTSASAQEIPKAVFFDMVRIVAAEMAPDFGVQLPAEEDEAGAMIAPGTLGMRNLRRHIGRAPTGLPARTEYF